MSNGTSTTNIYFESYSAPIYGRIVPLQHDINTETLYINNQSIYSHLIKQRKDNDNNNTIKLNK